MALGKSFPNSQKQVHLFDIETSLEVFDEGFRCSGQTTFLLNSRMDVLSGRAPNRSSNDANFGRVRAGQQTGHTMHYIK